MHTFPHQQGGCVIRNPMHGQLSFIDKTQPFTSRHDPWKILKKMPAEKISKPIRKSFLADSLNMLKEDQMREVSEKKEVKSKNCCTKCKINPHLIAGGVVALLLIAYLLFGNVFSYIN